MAIVATLGLIKLASSLAWPATAATTNVATPVGGTTTVPVPSTTTTTLPRPSVAPFTVLAKPKGTIPTFTSPGSTATGTTGTWYGFSLTLPVLSTQPGWLQVRLPERPNGSTAWVQASDVNLSWTPYRVVVSLSATHVVVYHEGYAIMSFPAGVGLPATPTPTGHFFVAVHESHPEEFYGPLILDTSAHSEAISSWEGQGDAVIAFHGPINSYADGRIGSTGTRISNGCIRMHDGDLAQLSVIPAGTPVDINP